MMALLMALVALWATVAIARVNEDLIEASKRGDLPEVKRLLAKGAEVNAKDEKGRTALMRASKRGQWEVMELLIKAGAK
jgi:ankyrin repeat protein